YGNAILSQYPIVAAETFALPGKLEARSLQKATIQYGMKEIVVYNTHLGVFTNEREKQMPVIEQMMDETDGPAIFLGDFNMEGHQPLLQRLFNRWQKVKLRVKSGTVFGGSE